MLAHKGPLVVESDRKREDAVISLSGQLGAMELELQNAVAPSSPMANEAARTALARRIVKAQEETGLLDFSAKAAGAE